MKQTFRLIGMITLAGIVLAACSEKVVDDEVAAAAALVNEVATEFVDAYYAQYPEEVYEVGYPGSPMDRFGDHGTARIDAFHGRVERWLERLRAIDSALLDGTPAETTYGFARERLEAIAARRVCRMDWWNISPTWTGWQPQLISTLAVQPVESAKERSDALSRLRDVARYLDTEIKILREGMENGYLAANSNVARVLKQVDTIIAAPNEESPFFDPAQRSSDDDFINEYRAILEDEVQPAIGKYRDFLAGEYQGRDEVGVSANPNGEECYDASVRYHSSLQMPAEEIYRLGLAEMSRIQARMLEIARDSFGTEDLKSLFETLRSDPRYTFETEQAVLDYARAAVERGRDALGDWFGYTPDAPLIIKASPAYEEDSGGGFYAAGSADGSRPAYYQVGTYNPRGIGKAGMESTAFHESYPGHHFQNAVAMSDEALHPILRFMYVSGTAEGWALYTERLADEMGLYSSDLDRLGMLSNQAFRAARLVVDPGVHVMGWTRDRAIDYMLEHTAEGYDAVASEVDRYIAVPGQATSYLLGSLEIQRLRREAEERLGDNFDIKGFHDTVIASGNLPLPMMRKAVHRWIREQH